MAISAHYYTSFFKSAFNKEVDLDEASKIKLMLCNEDYSPNQDTHRYKNSVTNEVSGTGYTAGGKALTSVTVTVGTKTITIDADDVSWTNATLVSDNAPRYGVLYYDTGTSSTSPLIGYIDFGDSTYAPNGGTLSIAWNSAGIATVTVS